MTSWCWATARPWRARERRELAECRRAFSLLRRPGPRSRFVSVIEPVKGTPAIRRAPRGDPGASEAIEIELAGGRRDLLLLDARNARGVWNGRPLAATAEWALLRSRGNAILGATLVQGSLSWGDLKMGSGPGSTHRLLTVDRAERSFLVEGHFRPDAGSVVTLDHAGKRISPYTVVSATEAGANTRLVVAEEPGFEWNAKQTATFLSRQAAASRASIASTTRPARPGDRAGRPAPCNLPRHRGVLCSGRPSFGDKIQVSKVARRRENAATI